ncbi:MAG: bis(5'-nucleosyl)-tetraphosphatase [Phycisphaerales bacterium JB063]
MKNDFSYGMIPFRVVEGRREFLLVQHHAGHWAFPKGHADEGESPLQAAQREMLEETGLAPVRTVSTPAFEERYKFIKRSGKKVRKTVTYYLCELAGDAAVQIQPAEIADHFWGDAPATRQRITFEEGREMFDQVQRYLETPPAASA